MQHDMATVADADGDAPIPAFAVSKGGVVLKHIFLNAPPSSPDRGVKEEEEDPPVSVGRHPDCHVLVDHPSVSRFHLQLQARRRQRRITVIDLRSVHGTWVSGQRIPPHTPVDLVNGDTLRLGASKREYRLLWLSLREALEMEDAPYMPPLPEDKEEPHAYQEASSHVVAPEQSVSADVEAHQETSQQIILEDIDFPAKVIPSAPPLSDFGRSFSVEESHENTEGVTEDILVDKNPISESFGSLIIQEMPAALRNAGTPVLSDKQDTSSQVSKRSKLKSVKSLRIDTGRSKDRSSGLSYSSQKGDQNEIPVCSQSCGVECTACIALFGISEFERPEEKEDMIAEDKGYMNPPASITMEGNKKEPNTENYGPQDSVDSKLQQKRIGFFDSAHFEDDAFTDREIPQWSSATVVNTESQPVSENLSTPELKHGGLVHRNLEGSFSNQENMAPNKIVEGSENYQFDSTICGNLFDNLDTEQIEGNEEICPLDMENITPNLSSGNIIMERSHIGLKPTISQELMDSISPLNLDHDNFSENENSILNTANQMISNEPISECMPISHLEFKDHILLDNENSVLAPGKYDAISPARQEDMSSDKENATQYDAISPTRQEDLSSNKENMTPASKVKPIVRRVLGSRIDNSVSAKKTSNKEKCNVLSAKSEKFHTVDYDVFYSDKENLTPVSSGMKARKCLPKNLIVDAHQDQEAFCSDKENMTPQSSAARKTRDMSENHARVESAITKKRVADRLPFQTLLSNSPLGPASGCNCIVRRTADIATGDLAIKLEDKLNNLALHNQESGRAGQSMKSWTMVANTDSLLDDESRKSIMLLKGIKGTHLFVPRIVIRELDSMKQREGMFRRSTKATSVLQWIEECMATESWWIHVQSSSEMQPIAPTPPATPSAQRIDEEIKVGSAGGSFINPMAALFSPRGFELADIVSPKPEDRVLDCALLLNKLRSDHNIVILSDSVALKIKAMAEGVVCEGAREFRESLMNPCSSRFMWAASAPRGPAWSRLDAAALAEDYYNSHHHQQHARKQQQQQRRPAAEAAAAKGLKLILRHNSMYAQATTTDAARMTTPPLISLASV